VRPPVDVPRVRDYLRMLARAWPVLLVATILSGAAVVASDRYVLDPVYAASTQLFTVVPGDAQTHSAYEGNRGGTVRISTYAQLAVSTIVTQRSIDELGLSDTPAQLAKRISVRSVPDTLTRFAYPMSVLINVQVTGSDPKSTVDVANAVGRNLSAASQELEWSGTESGPSLVLIDQATTATNVGRPWYTNAGIGAVVGLIFSCLAVIAIGVRRDEVLSREQLGHIAKQSASGKWTDES
jgi:capsular polysaccharide biosynthesis protein